MVTERKNFTLLKQNLQSHRQVILGIDVYKYYNPKVYDNVHVFISTETITIQIIISYNFF